MKRKIIPYNPELKEFARSLRNNSTPGEITLWQVLRNKQLHGYDFHRQKPLLNYIVDFYCYELDLVIELDGRYHNNNETYHKDLIRDEDLRTHKLTVLRFTETEIKDDILNVLRTLETYIFEHSSFAEHTPNPSREGK